MNLTDRIWYDLVTSGYQAIFLSIHNVKIRNLSDRVNLITSIVTSASVGGWAIWENIPEVWALIIAIAQIINISKPYISKIRDYELFHELQLYYLERHYELDYLWLQISLGELSEPELQSEYKRIYEKYFNLSKKFLKTRISSDEKLESLAIKEWNKSLTKYGITDE